MVRRATALGADSFLRKPYSIRDIVQRIEALLYPATPKLAEIID